MFGSRPPALLAGVFPLPCEMSRADTSVWLSKISLWTRRGSGANYGPATDHAGQLSAAQRSTMDISDRWFTLDNGGGPIWGSKEP